MESCPIARALGLLDIQNVCIPGLLTNPVSPIIFFSEFLGFSFVGISSSSNLGGQHYSDLLYINYLCEAVTVLVILMNVASIAVIGLRKLLKRAAAIPKQFLIILLTLDNH